MLIRAATLACLVCMCVCVAQPEGESAAGCAQGRQVRVGYGSRGKGERVAELSAVTAAAAGVERRGGAREGRWRGGRSSLPAVPFLCYSTAFPFFKEKLENKITTKLCVLRQTC